MAINVYVSRYSNNSDIIKNSFSRRSSNAMSAYISNQSRYDYNFQLPAKAKQARDDGEVEFTALLLPSDTPKSVFRELKVPDFVEFDRIESRFIDASKVVGREHFLIQDDQVTSLFWSLNDQNIHAIEQASPIYQNRETELRLYDLYLFTSPVAHKHFPPEMNVTAADLRELDERAIYEVCDEFFLSQGLAVELGRHQNKENIIHYHVQTTNRVFKYKYEQDHFNFNHSAFVRWLSKSKSSALDTRVLRNQQRTEEWRIKFENDPSDYNRQHLEDWSQKVRELKQEQADIIDIIAGIKKSGVTYSALRDKYIENQRRKIETTLASDSIFSSHKGESELFLDTHRAMDLIKERYAQVLNRLLIEAELIKPESELYKYSKSLRDYITIKEARVFNISPEKRREINRSLNQVFKMDEEFFNQDTHKKPKNKKYRTGQRLIIHGLKTLIKQHLDLYKPKIAQSETILKTWVKMWKKQLDLIRGNYGVLVNTLLQHQIYNFDWRKAVKSNLVTVEIEDTLTNLDDEPYRDVPAFTSDSNENSSHEVVLSPTPVESFDEPEVGVIDIEIPDAYEDELELNYESLRQTFEEDEDEAPFAYDADESQYNPNFETPWELFHRLLKLYEAELEQLYIDLDFEEQTAVFWINARQQSVELYELLRWMTAAELSDISLEESIYEHRPDLLEAAYVEEFQRELERY